MTTSERVMELMKRNNGTITAAEVTRITGDPGNSTSNKAMTQRWRNYQDAFDYAKEIEFDDVCDSVLALMDQPI